MEFSEYIHIYSPDSFNLYLRNTYLLLAVTLSADSAHDGGGGDSPSGRVLLPFPFYMGWDGVSWIDFFFLVCG